MLPQLTRRVISSHERTFISLSPLRHHHRPSLPNQSQPRPRIPQSLTPRTPHRHASTSSRAPLFPRSRLILYTTLTALLSGGAYLYLTDARSAIHQYVTPRIIRFLYPSAEDAHHFGTASLSHLFTLGLHPRERPSHVTSSPDLAVEVFGHRLANPVGISAGLDKNAEIPSPLFALGPAIVEVGGATPLPQHGNPTPRVFRVASQDAMINRYGLNSEGADAMARRLRLRVRQFAHGKGWGASDAAEKRVLDGDAGVPPGSLQNGRLLAVQVAKNKATPEADLDAVKRDYTYCVDRLAPYADIIVVNVSSPNTPGLRSLQRVEPLTSLLTVVVGAAKAVPRKSKPAVMVKVSPDEDSDEQIRGIVEAVFKSGVDGVVVGNTTNRRPAATAAGDVKVLAEQGGYSGPWLFPQTKSLVGRYRRALDAYKTDAVHESPSPPASSSQEKEKQRKVIFASGGISTAAQAQQVLDAGADIAMVYTALTYRGVGLVSRLKHDLLSLRNAPPPPPAPKTP